MKALEIENLCKKYKSFQLQDINLSLEQGYIMGLIGKNGAGKTTLLRLIANQLLKSSGSIKVLGYDYDKDVKRAKDSIGFIFDDYPYLSGHTLELNGQLLGRYYSQWNQGDFLNYLERFNLDKNKKFWGLSKGMKVKFQLAFALAHDPKLLILDEPTAGLDPIFRREFIEILCDLIKDEKKSIIYSTHITSDLDKIADYVTFIDQGRVLFSDTKELLQENYHIIKGPNSQLQVLGKLQNLHKIHVLNKVQDSNQDPNQDPNQVQVLGLKKQDTYFEALVKGRVHLTEEESLKLNILIPKLEDIMLFLCDEKARKEVTNIVEIA